ncbi:hypothetical protein GCM10023238_00230 [Streptomyces heliomycini]
MAGHADDGQVTGRVPNSSDRVRRDVTDYQPRTDFEAAGLPARRGQVAAPTRATQRTGESTVGDHATGRVWFGLISRRVVTIG